jgi:hypothetical protein
MLIGERIWSRELAEVVFCMKDIPEATVRVVVLVDEVNQNTFKCCATLNWLKRCRGRVELCLNSVKTMLE